MDKIPHIPVKRLAKHFSGKYYMQMLILENLLLHRNEAITVYELISHIQKFSTIRILNSPFAMIYEVLIELRLLEFVSIELDEESPNDSKVIITEKGVEALQSFSLQSVAITSFHSYESFLLTRISVIIAVTALIVSLTALFIKI